MPDGVSFRAFGDEAVLLNVQTGQYHGLDATATAFWMAITSQPTRAMAVATLVTRFDADERVITQDLDRFCSDLVERGLIQARD